MNGSITLYSTGCPKCVVLKKKLDAKGITYNVSNDTEEVKKMGFQEVPILVINEQQPNINDPLTKAMTFTEAVAWINEQK